MMGPYGALWRLLHSGSPIVAIVYPDFPSREEWAVEIEDAFRSVGLDSKRIEGSGLEPPTPAIPVLVLADPQQESEIVERLAVQRDTLLSRDAPIVIFLLRRGGGLRRLAEEPALAGVLAGSILDPEEEAIVDVQEASTEFFRNTGLLPTEWLRRHANGEFGDTLTSAFRYVEALFLTGAS